MKRTSIHIPYLSSLKSFHSGSDFSKEKNDIFTEAYNSYLHGIYFTQSQKKLTYIIELISSIHSKALIDKSSGKTINFKHK